MTNNIYVAIYELQNMVCEYSTKISTSETK